jgi:16S rRNA U516 pseudouridylate synthase RsuA-like enzyme
MFAAAGATVLALHRTRFGHLQLDDSLAPDTWRELPLDAFTSPSSPSLQA